MSFLESLQWRYAVKRMNGKKVPQEKVDIILEAARLAPTSAGLQPFSIFVITDPELLKKIQPIATHRNVVRMPIGRGTHSSSFAFDSAR